MLLYGPIHKIWVLIAYAYKSLSTTILAYPEGLEVYMFFCFVLFSFFFLGGGGGVEPSLLIEEEITKITSAGLYYRLWLL